MTYEYAWGSAIPLCDHQLTLYARDLSKGLWLVEAESFDEWPQPERSRLLSNTFYDSKTSAWEE